VKKTIGLILAFFISISLISASAISGNIYFELPEKWAETSKIVYCHIWIDGESESQYVEWKTEEAIMTKVEGNKYSYNVPEGKWDMVVFGTDNDVQTYDLHMGEYCIGDTAYVTEDVVENPIDPQKTCYIARWRENNDKSGPRGNPIVLYTDPIDMDSYLREHDAVESSNDSSISNNNDTTDSRGNVLIFTTTMVIIVLIIIVLIAGIIVGAAIIVKKQQ